jgi:hypothetical protein
MSAFGVKRTLATNCSSRSRFYEYMLMIATVASRDYTKQKCNTQVWAFGSVLAARSSASSGTSNARTSWSDLAWPITSLSMFLPPKNIF